MNTIRTRQVGDSDIILREKHGWSGDEYIIYEKKPDLPKEKVIGSEYSLRKAMVLFDSIIDSRRKKNVSLL